MSIAKQNRIEVQVTVTRAGPGSYEAFPLVSWGNMSCAVDQFDPLNRYMSPVSEPATQNVGGGTRNCVKHLSGFSKLPRLSPLASV